MLKQISQEVLLRFRSEILVIDALSENDYRNIATRIAATLPDTVRRFEELIADALIESAPAAGN